VVINLTLNLDSQTFGDLVARLDRLNDLMTGVITKGNNLMATIDDLTAAVAQLKTKVDAFGPAVDGLEQKIKDALSGENLSQATKDKIDAAFATVTGLVGESQAALDDAATQDADGN